MSKILVSLVMSLMISMLILSSVNALQINKFPNPNIKVTFLNQDPDPVYPGDTVEVRLKIENNGSQTSDDVIITFGEQYPFKLYSGSAIRNVGQLRAVQTGADAVIVDYIIKVDDNAEEGENELKLRVQMGDRRWIYEDSQFTIDVAEYDRPDIKAYIRESQILKAGEKGDIVIEVANTDVGDAKFLQLTLLPSEDYNVLSSSEYVYLGDVDSDDTESESFSIYVSPKANGKVTFPVKVEYQDSNEKKYEKNYNLKLNIFSEDELLTFGLRKKDNTTVVIAVILILVIAFFVWRRLKKRK
jgi:hypothetical protein